MHRISSALVVVVVWFTGSLAGEHPAVWLELPELKIEVPADTAAEVPAAKITYFTIHLTAKSQLADYGSILSRINTEAANIVMTTSRTSDALLCQFDLARHGGFLLHGGRNSVEIWFTDAFRHQYYSSFLLILPEGPVVRARPTSLSPKRIEGEKYAVVIGISKYKYAGAGLTDLRFADRDASLMREFLLSPEAGHFKEENIRYLVNEDATAQQERSALFTFLGKATSEDMVVIYFAGHGVKDRGNYYLTAYDTKMDDLGGTALLMSEFQDLFRVALKTHHVVTFVDACHSGAVSENNLVNQYVQHSAQEDESAVMTASDAAQKSLELEKWGGGHGVFTYYVHTGLKGAADENHDGTVTVGELMNYVSVKVRQDTADAQTPLFSAGSMENVPLAGRGLGKSPAN